MGGVMQYNSKNKIVKVILKSGCTYSNVKIYPDEYDPYSRWHTIERENGSTRSIFTEDIAEIIYT